MNLFVSILFSTILGVILLLISPVYGGLIAFGIVVGCLFRGLFILNEINKKLSKSSVKTDKTYALLRSALELRNENVQKSQLDIKG